MCIRDSDRIDLAGADVDRDCMDHVRPTAHRNRYVSQRGLERECERRAGCRADVTPEDGEDGTASDAAAGESGGHVAGAVQHTAVVDKRELRACGTAEAGERNLKDNRRSRSHVLTTVQPNRVAAQEDNGSLRGVTL